MNTEPERITLKKIGTDLLAQVNLERGLGYTIKQFTLRPGRAVQEFLFEDRSRYVKPLSFLLLTATIATFLLLELVIKQSPDMTALTQSEQWQKTPEFLKPGLKLIIFTFQKYFNILYLFSLPMISLAAYWLFRRKYAFNLAEILVVNAYIFSIQSLLYILKIPFLATPALAAWSSAHTILGALYFVFAYRQIFNLTLWKAVLYSFAVYMIAQLLNLAVLGVVVVVAAVVG